MFKYLTILLFFVGCGDIPQTSLQYVYIDSAKGTVFLDTTRLTNFEDYQNHLIRAYHNTILMDMERADREFADSIQLLDSLWLTKQEVLNGDSTFTQTWYEENMIIICPNGGKGFYRAVFYHPETKLCICDTVTGKQKGVLF